MMHFKAGEKKPNQNAEVDMKYKQYILKVIKMRTEIDELEIEQYTKQKADIS